MEDQPAPAEKRSEITMLRVVVVCLVVLYIVLAGYLIYSNQSIGSTQLGYSSLLATQSGKLQGAVTQLITTVGQMQEDDLGRMALLNSRLKQLELQTQALTKALDTADKHRQQIAQANSGELARLREQITALNRDVTALKTEQQHAAAALQAGLQQLQNGLTQSAAAGAQRDQLLNGVRADLADLREEFRKTSQAVTSQAQLSLLTRLVAEAALHAHALNHVSPANATEAHQAWQQARLLADTTAATPELSAKSKELAVLAADLGKRLTLAVTAEIARYERQASETKDAAAATGAWTKAGEWLRSYPVSDDPAVMDRLGELILAHEAAHKGNE